MKDCLLVAHNVASKSFNEAVRLLQEKMSGVSPAECDLLLQAAENARQEFHIARDALVDHIGTHDCLNV